MKTRLFLFTVLVMNCLTGFSQKYLWSSQFGIADVETSAKSMAIQQCIPHRLFHRSRNDNW